MSLNKHNQEDIEKEIKNLISKYAQSIDNASDINLASQIWLKSPEVSFIHPRGHEHGWEEIKKNFYGETMDNWFIKRKLNIYNISIQVFGDTVITEFYWQFDATFKDGDQLRTEGRESQVYIRNEESQWVLIHVHYSNMPVEGEREGF
ncbi:YybH family protein [Terribacillus saccharophilus]|uniref:YybH family protein n=1 Tax=Terribacillus saccharophilus TaxID=361277 RepID=UPI0039822585